MQRTFNPNEQEQNNSQYNQQQNQQQQQQNNFPTPIQKKRPHQTSSKWNLENALLELNWDACETISIKGFF